MMVIEDDNDKVDVEDDTVNHNNDEDYGVMMTINIMMIIVRSMYLPTYLILIYQETIEITQHLIHQIPSLYLI